MRSSGTPAFGARRDDARASPGFRAKRERARDDVRRRISLRVWVAAKGGTGTVSRCRVRQHLPGRQSHPHDSHSRAIWSPALSVQRRSGHDFAAELRSRRWPARVRVRARLRSRRPRGSSDFRLQCHIGVLNRDAPVRRRSSACRASVAGYSRDGFLNLRVVAGRWDAGVLRRSGCVPSHSNHSEASEGGTYRRRPTVGSVGGELRARRSG